jgi:hypothetical protein
MPTKTSQEILLEKINNLSLESKKYILEKELWEGKKLFLLKNNYPYLPIQLSIHESNKIKNKILKALSKQMLQNPYVLRFLLINLQYFVEILMDENKFKKYFSKEIYNSKIEEESLQIMLDKIKRSSFFDELDELHDNISLKIFKFFGFINPEFESKDLDADELEVFISKFLSYYFKRNILKLKKEPKYSFRKDILVPLKVIFNLLGILKESETDDSNFVIIRADILSKPDIQNFFTCYQYHLFFEEYVNSLYSQKGIIIKNPLVLFNPSETKKYRKNILEGYFELDGSLFISKDKEIILLECKNSSVVKMQHLTHFLGKVSLIEKVYEVNIKKCLFSTGWRLPLWKEIELFDGCRDIKIFCRQLFLDGYSKHI